MPYKYRWMAAGIVVMGALGLLAGALVLLARDSGRLSYTVPTGQAHNALTLRLSGANIELLDGATHALLQSQPLAGTEGVTIQGVPGSVNDSLTVDLSGGALALPDGIHFDGGAGGYDTLIITGGQAAAGSYQATGPNSGVISHAGTRIFFSNLEPITDTASAINFTVSGTAGNNTINIVNGGSCGLGCQLTQVNSPSFESIAFAHKTNVTVNGGDGADTFNLDNTVPASGLSKLVLDAGGNPGDVIGIKNFDLLTGTLSLTNVITVSQSGILAVGSLAVHAAGPVNLGNPSNQVATVAGNTTANGAGFNFASNVPILTVGTVEGIAGISTVNGAGQIQNFPAGAALVVNNAISTAGGNLTLFADDMTFNAALNAGSGIVYLDNETFSEPIALGTKPANTLGLLQSDLSQIAAGTLRIGDMGTDSGGLTVSADITAPVGWSTLDLAQATTIDGLFSADLTVPNLALVTNGGHVSFQFNGNHVSNLAAATHGGSFSFEAGGHMTLATVDGVSGLKTAGGAISLGSRTGGLTVAQAVLAGAGAIDMGAQESTSPTDNLTVNPGVVVSSTTNNIILDAGDQLNLEAGSVIAAGGGGTVSLAFGVSDTDGVSGGTIAGTVAGTNPIIFGGDTDATLLVDFNAGAALPNELSYNGGNGLKGLTVSDAGGSSPHQYSAAGLGVSRDFANLIHCDRVQIVTVIGGSAADTFGVGPDAGAVIHIIGGLPGSPPGDGLIVNTLTTTNPTLSITSFDATGATGNWTFGNRQPVDFTGIDSFANLSHQVFMPVVRK